MKPHPALTPRQEARAERILYGAMLTLRSVDELRSFCRDLCTPAEIEAMAGRWSVVECLERGLPYREIHKLTGVSVTTVARVARCRTDGAGGYGLAVQRGGARNSSGTPR
jgi:TrpR-related protein YerC/YecD